LAHSAEALGGEAIGARDRKAFRDAVRVSVFWGMVVAVGFTLVYLIAGPFIIDVLTGIETVRETSREYLVWSVAMPLIAVCPFLLDGIFLGGTRGATMRNAMIVSLLIYLACCYILVPLWGNDGLWASLAIFMGARGLALGVRYPALARSVGRKG
jgi:MATE family multidrug resistance protein